VPVECRHARLGDAEVRRVATQLFLVLRRLLHQHRKVPQRRLGAHPHTLVVRKLLQLLHHLSTRCTQKNAANCVHVQRKRKPSCIQTHHNRSTCGTENDDWKTRCTNLHCVHNNMACLHGARKKNTTTCVHVQQKNELYYYTLHTNPS